MQLSTAVSTFNSSLYMRTGSYVTWVPSISVPANYFVILFGSFSRVHDCERRTERQNVYHNSRLV